MMTRARYHILINQNSGTALKMGLEEMERQLRDNEHLHVESLTFSAPDQFMTHLKEIAENDIPVLIGGGDGTILQAAEFYLENDKAFGILPLGTMNMLACDLDIPTDFKAAIKSYATTQSMHIDVGLLNNHKFFCAACIGVIPEASEFREEIRGNIEIINNFRLGAFVFDEMKELKRRLIKITMDKQTKTLKTNMVIISNNEYDIAIPGHFNSFRRSSMGTGKMGVYVIHAHNLWERIRVLISLNIGLWKKDSALKSYSAKEVVIDTPHQNELVSLDGEPIEVETPLRFKSLSQALHLIVPQTNLNEDPAS